MPRFAVSAVTHALQMPKVRAAHHRDQRPSVHITQGSFQVPLQPHLSSVQLTVEDVSCTEAWLKVSLTDADEPRTVEIQRDGQQVISVQMGSSTDSLCLVEGLLPRHTYSFVAHRAGFLAGSDDSSAVQATTMDTTSHNFTFHLDTLGVTSSTRIVEFMSASALLITSQR